MKTCTACGEEFTDDFRFCPLDGTEIAIDAGAQQAPAEFQLTFIDDEGLAHRLANQLSFVTDQAKQAWPSFRNDPIGFVGRQIDGARQVLKQTLARPHVLSGAATALLVVAAVVLSVFVLERHVRKVADADLINDRDEVSRTVEIDLRREPQKDPGIGAGDKGRVGFGRGKGEGSGPVPARSQGGGGSGNHDRAESSVGRVPVPSIIPAPISTTMARLPQALPDAGIDIDARVRQSLRQASHRG